MNKASKVRKPVSRIKPVKIRGMERIAIYLTPAMNKKLRQIVEDKHSKMSTYIVGELIEPRVLKMDSKMSAS